MPRGKVTLSHGGKDSHFPVGHDLEKVRALLKKLRPTLEAQLKAGESKVTPGRQPRAWVMHLGVSLSGLTAAAARQNLSGIYSKSELQPRLRPYWEMLEDLGWAPEVRYVYYAPGGRGLHLYVMKP